MTTEHGWYPQFDDRVDMYVPVLWTNNCVARLDYPFDYEEDCLEFIKFEVLGQGLRDE